MGNKTFWLESKTVNLSHSKTSSKATRITYLIKIRQLMVLEHTRKKKNKIKNKNKRKQSKSFITMDDL